MRAWDALGHAHRHLLWMARLAERSTTHWLTPARRAEADLPGNVVAELRRTTDSADPNKIPVALRAAWRCGRRYWIELARRHNQPVPEGLFAEIDAAL